jgi:protease YdgD
LLAPENSDHRNIIVTVAHAFLAPDDTQLTPCDFLPGGDPALAIAVSFTYLGTANPVGNWTQDWAVAHLARPAPETFQPLTPEILSVSEADDARANGTAFSLAGHNGETGPLMLSDNCGPKPKRNADINRFDDRAFNHDCDMMPGWSGGPLMVERDGKRYVIAVNATELNALVTVAGEAYRGAYNANTAVRMDGAFYEAFLRLTRDGPPRRTGPAPASCLVWQPPPIAPRRC